MNNNIETEDLVYCFENDKEFCSKVLGLQLWDKKVISTTLFMIPGDSNNEIRQYMTEILIDITDFDSGRFIKFLGEVRGNEWYVDNIPVTYRDDVNTYRELKIKFVANNTEEFEDKLKKIAKRSIEESELRDMQKSLNVSHDYGDIDDSLENRLIRIEQKLDSILMTHTPEYIPTDPDLLKPYC